MIKTCEQCGKEYKAWNSKQKYCSRDCWGESQWKDAPQHTCLHCGETFRRWSYVSKNKFCSTTCAGKHNKNWGREKMGEYYKYTCLYCGEEKEAYKTKSIPHRKFCSTSCSNKHRAKNRAPLTWSKCNRCDKSLNKDEKKYCTNCKQILGRRKKTITMRKRKIK